MFASQSLRNYKINGNLALPWWWTGFLTFSSGVMTHSLDQQSYIVPLFPFVVAQPLPQWDDACPVSLFLTTLSSVLVLSNKVKNRNVYSTAEKFGKYWSKYSQQETNRYSYFGLRWKITKKKPIFFRSINCFNLLA